MRFILYSGILLGLGAGCIAQEEPSFDDATDPESPSEAETPAPLTCNNPEPLLAITSEGGMMQFALNDKIMPYGHWSWFVNGRCETSSYEARTRTTPGNIQGSTLSPLQIEWAKAMAQSPLLAKYNGQVFPAPQANCEGGQVRVSNRQGSFVCHCSCHADFVQLPPELRSYVDELFEFRRLNTTQLSPRPPADLGLLAINPSSALWQPIFDQLPDEHWQTRELPVDFATLSTLQPAQPIRVTDPAINTTLRQALSEHQAWQSAQINPNCMYLRDRQGQKVVLCAIELAEPGLIPKL